MDAAIRHSEQAVWSPRPIALVCRQSSKAFLSTSSTVWLTKAVDISVSYPVHVVAYTVPSLRRPPVLLVRQRVIRGGKLQILLGLLGSASRLSGAFLAGGLTLSGCLSRDLDAGLFGELSQVLDPSSGSLLRDDILLRSGINSALSLAHSTKAGAILESLDGGAHSPLGAQVLGITALILLHLLDG